MDTLENVLRPDRREIEERRDPLDIFREFIACLDRAACGRKPAKPNEHAGK